jgi:type I restriction enzyme S subunit
MRRHSRGITDFRLRLYWDEFKNIRLALPNAAEREAILQYIDRETSKIDALAEEAQTVIVLLQERRAALISAAVTGKIDVRQPAEVVQFPLDRARARALIAIEIIERSAHQATFGRVKLQKITFLAEAHAGITELAGSYTREAAGPLDRPMVEEMENGARSVAGIVVDQSGGAGTAVVYRLGHQRGAHRQELAGWLGVDRTAKLDKLITDFADLSTHAAEAVATLYGVWNDALLEGAAPSGEDIISGFLDDWHPEKKTKFRADELRIWLDWMRRHDIVPDGTGPKTSTGRLFV